MSLPVSRAYVILALLIGIAGPLYGQLPPVTPEQSAKGVLVARAVFEPGELALTRGDTAHIRVVLQDEAGNPVGRIGDRGPRIVLLGHIDTVPGVVPIRVEEGKLYGRGSVDAKGPLAAFVAAASRAAAQGELACQVEIVGCVEEEVPSSRGAHFKAMDAAPDLCINGEPSGWEGITLGYKGYLRARLTLRSAAAHGAHEGASAAALACRLWTRLEHQAELFRQEREKDGLLEGQAPPSGQGVLRESEPETGAPAAE